MVDLKQQLRSYFPVRWFDQDASDFDRLLSIIAAGLDVAQQVSDTVSRESVVETAVDALEEMELELGLPSGQTLPIEARRRRIIARRWEREGPINRQRFEQALSYLLGVPVTMIPDYAGYSVTFEFPALDNPVDLHDATEFIRRNKRAHIAHDFSASPPGATVSVSTQVYHFGVEYPICGVDYPMEADGNLLSGVVGVSPEGYHHSNTTHPIAGDFVVGQEE